MTAAEPSTIIVAESDRADDPRFQIPQSILAHADELVE
jgi:hypothetical protein